MSSFQGTTYTLEQYPDPSAIIGGLATYPLSFPHPIEVVSQTVGTPLWPQQVQYTGSPISAMVYSPSNPTYDKNSLPPIDVFSGKYKPASMIPPAPALALPDQRQQYQHTPLWKYGIIGGLSIAAAVLIILYFWPARRKIKI